MSFLVGQWLSDNFPDVLRNVVRIAVIRSRSWISKWKLFGRQRCTEENFRNVAKYIDIYIGLLCSDDTSSISTMCRKDGVS